MYILVVVAVNFTLLFVWNIFLINFSGFETGEHDGDAALFLCDVIATVDGEVSAGQSLHDILGGTIKISGILIQLLFLEFSNCIYFYLCRCIFLFFDQKIALDVVVKVKESMTT